ncbi:MAG: hypothetical protein FJ288_16380 [Planctomycetes bacterium]|nr:hypothetical protein [Planctomycetota bacterium]
MKTFTDSQGRTWSLVVNVSAVKRVRGLLDVDLLDVAGGDLLSRLADDPCLLVDVLFALCKPEADARAVTDEEFGRGMVGGVLDEAAAALMKELLDFFPSAQRARALGRMAGKLKEQQAAVAEALAAIQAAGTGEAQAQTPAWAGEAQLTVGGSFGNSPASAAATPDR